MTTYKRIDGDYYIQTINDDDYVYIDTHTLDVSGNLNVAGNLTYINVTELNVTDPFIVLNSSNTGTYPPNAGVLTHKTSSDYAGIRYNRNSDAWELSTSTSASGTTGSWTSIATGNTTTPAGGSNTEIQFNDAGSFGGNVAFTFNYTTKAVGLDGKIVLADQASTPSLVANSTVLYANTQGSGGTGLYFVDGTTSDELVSKAKAIVYSIIF